MTLPAAYLKSGLALLILFLTVMAIAAPTGFGAATLLPILWAAIGWGLAGAGARAVAAIIVLGGLQALLTGAPLGAYVFLGLVLFSVVLAVNSLRLFDRLAWRIALTLLAFVFGVFCLNAVVVLSGFQSLSLLQMVWMTVINLAVYWGVAPLFDVGPRQSGAEA